MPREDRRVIFDNEEVYKAIFALCTQKEMKKPIPGHIAKFTISEDEIGTVKIDIVNPLDTERPSAREEYSRDFIAAALMLFCRGSGIPLPKSARKSVMLVDGAMVLRVQI
jgi:hypothetical protein